MARAATVSHAVRLSRWTRRLAVLLALALPAIAPAQVPTVTLRGFAWDSNRGDIVLYGGGHANYSGNDVYRWRSSTLLWERAAYPSEISCSRV